jgi:hypothetical protein
MWSVDSEGSVSSRVGESGPGTLPLLLVLFLLRAAAAGSRCEVT